MKISLGEIWNFSELIESSENGWSFELVAGSVQIKEISHKTLLDLREDKHYDTELLPLIFTFREILWQPDVFTESGQSLPGLRILKSHCEEIIGDYSESGIETLGIYSKLIEGLSRCCEIAIAELENENLPVTKSLGELRTAAFPILKFFIFHPKNRLDYYRDAVNRLNYAVKVMLTEFYSRYTELSDPYWEVAFNPKERSSGTIKNKPEEKEKS